MNVQQNTRYGGEQEVVTTEDAVKSLVDQAPDYHDGEIESQRRQIAKLTELLAAAIAALPADAQLQVLNAVSYDWERAPDLADILS